MTTQSQSQYEPASRVPLIKSPSLRVPRPVELPPDIHPLPDDVTPYFVYPFTLEPHVITMEDSRRSTLVAHAVRREAFLKAREEEKERRSLEALHRIAPGFEPRGTPLVPVKRSSMMASPISKTSTESSEHKRSKSVMDDLVDQLAALESQ